jgi:hypothetical protein
VVGPLRVEPTESRDLGPCACCGSETRRVWGFVYSPTELAAAYFVQWALGRVADHGAIFDFILGGRGNGTTATDRVLVTLDYRLTDTGPAFMVIDSASRPAAKNELVGRALARTEVVGQPIAERAFAVADAVLAEDARIAELLGPYRMGSAPRKPWWQFWR